MQSPDTNFPSADGGSLATQFWVAFQERLTAILRESLGGKRPRIAAMNVPIATATGPTVGFLTSVAVTFNCRIVAYQIFGLQAGVLSLDIERSTPSTHRLTPGIAVPLRFPSLIGTTTGLPAINGVYAENLDTSSWVGRDLDAGDMLHFWIKTSNGLLLFATMVLYLQDLDERVNYGIVRYT